MTLADGLPLAQARVTRTLQITHRGGTITLTEEVVPIDPGQGILPLPQMDAEAGTTFSVSHQIDWAGER